MEACHMAHRHETPFPPFSRLKTQVRYSLSLMNLRPDWRLFIVAHQPGGSDDLNRIEWQKKDVRPGRSSPCCIFCTSLVASGRRKMPFTFLSPVPKQTPQMRTPRPKHWGHSTNSYVSLARLRFKALHFPVPPHISQGVAPVPAHSIHLLSAGSTQTFRNWYHSSKRQPPCPTSLISLSMMVLPNPLGKLVQLYIWRHPQPCAQVFQRASRIHRNNNLASESCTASNSGLSLTTCSRHKEGWSWTRVTQ